MRLRLLRPVLFLLVILLLGSCSNPERDFKNAEQANTEQAFKEFVKKYPDSPLAAQASNRIEELAYDKATGMGTPSAYQTFLTQHPTSRFAGKAQEALENVEFAQDLQEPTVSNLERLLRRYPASTNVPTAKSKLAQLLLPGVVESNKVTDYESFLKSFAGTHSANTAKLKLIKLEYKLAVREDTIDSYQSFLTKFPQTSYTDDVKKRLNAQTEERDWNRALLQNTLESYLRFHSSHPSSEKVIVLQGALYVNLGSPGISYQGSLPFVAGPDLQSYFVSIRNLESNESRFILSLEDGVRWGLVQHGLRKNQDMIQLGNTKIGRSAIEQMAGNASNVIYITTNIVSGTAVLVMSSDRSNQRLTYNLVSFQRGLTNSNDVQSHYTK